MEQPPPLVGRRVDRNVDERLVRGGEAVLRVRVQRGGLLRCLGDLRVHAPFEVVDAIEHRVKPCDDPAELGYLKLRDVRAEQPLEQRSETCPGLGFEFRNGVDLRERRKERLDPELTLRQMDDRPELAIRRLLSQVDEASRARLELADRLVDHPPERIAAGELADKSPYHRIDVALQVVP